MEDGGLLGPLYSGNTIVETVYVTDKLKNKKFFVVYSLINSLTPQEFKDLLENQIIDLSVRSESEAIFGYDFPAPNMTVWLDLISKHNIVLTKRTELGVPELIVPTIDLIQLPAILAVIRIPYIKN